MDISSVFLGHYQISYNSCRNRHCPKCQGSNQAFWVEDRINHAYPVNHYHIVFTVPEALHSICMLDSKWFYNHLFAAVWDTLRSFSYTHYSVESGAICVLHTWGQNLSLHPHIHCLVPALGYTLRGEMKHIGKGGKYLYPINQLSEKFQGKFMAGVKNQLAKGGLVSQYRSSVEKAWSTPWVVFCEPSLGKPEHVVGYLGQYIHRVAISNHRIMQVDDRNVRFMLKDNRDHGRVKTATLTGEEFLRRFCLHILPRGFVKIRYYGIYSTRFKTTLLNESTGPGSYCTTYPFTTTGFDTTGNILIISAISGLGLDCLKYRKTLTKPNHFVKSENNTRLKAKCNNHFT